MKRALLVALLFIAADASAATAYLQSCQSGTSVTGRMIYVGTYNYGGQYFTRNFDHWCPMSVEVY
jgi:hypothetical protein